jgi:hypothetical protein
METQRVAGFGLDLPIGWVEIAPDLTTELDLEQRLERAARLSDFGIPPAIESLLTSFLEWAATGEVIFAAYLFDVIATAADPASLQPLLAILTVSASSLSGYDENTLDDFRAELVRAYGDELVGASLLTTAEDRAGMAVQIRRKSSIPQADGDAVDVDYVDLRAYIPVPETGQLAVLSMVSANTDFERELAELFGSLVPTFALEHVNEAEG